MHPFTKLSEWKCRLLARFFDVYCWLQSEYRVFDSNPPLFLFLLYRHSMDTFVRVVTFHSLSPPFLSYLIHSHVCVRSFTLLVCDTFLRKQFNIQVLQEFVRLHKFHGMDLVQALRYIHIMHTTPLCVCVCVPNPMYRT